MHFVLWICNILLPDWLILRWRHSWFSTGFISFLLFIFLLKLTIDFLQSFLGLIQPSIHAEPLITLTSVLTLFDCYQYNQWVFISPSFSVIMFVTNPSQNSLFARFNPFYFHFSLKPDLCQHPLFWTFLGLNIPLGAW